MRKYINLLLATAAVVGLSACNDYLDKEPQDKLIPENYFTSADNLKAYTLNYYTILPSHSDNAYGLGTFSSDNGTDNQAGRSASSRFAPGEWRVGSGNDNWGFGNIRGLNYFLEYAQPNYDAGNITGAQAQIDQAMGEAHFFLAYTYWAGYQAIGDYPILDGVLPDDKEITLEASKRKPRNQVARYILDHLTEAARLLPEASAYGKNGLTKDCANLFRSRVALFEGTWLKYHKGTALVPGGPGWPGNSADLNGFDIDSEINYFLTEAMASAKLVGDKFVGNLVENTDTPEGMGPGFSELNPYYCMFSADNSGAYDEVLLYRAYSLSQGVVTQMQAQFQKNAGGSGWTRGMVASFLMRNGLPIYAAGSGYDPAWEDQGVTATLQGRDSRIQIFTKTDHSIITYGLDGNSPAEYRMGWMFGGEDLTCCPTGWAVKKGQAYNYAQAQGNLQSTTGSIIFRAAEALLNYMEASYELNHTIDGTADSYWRAIRTRAKVYPDYNKTISLTDMNKEAENDWGAYSAGALLTDRTLYNIRRERRCELLSEGFRDADLKRWRSYDQLITSPAHLEGMHLWNTPMQDWYTDLVWNEANANVSAPEKSEYLRPFERTEGQAAYNGCTWRMAHYLNPLPINELMLTSPDGASPSESVLYQNPYWPLVAGKPAEK